MKKVFFFVACTSLMAACGKGNKAETPAVDNDSDMVANTTQTSSDTLTFKGEGPAADGTYEYSLSLYGNQPQEAALTVVGNTPQGKDTISMTTGVANVFEKDGKTYYRVSEDKTDSLTFVKVDDSTLRLVNSDLQESPNKELNTDLKIVK